MSRVKSKTSGNPSNGWICAGLRPRRTPAGTSPGSGRGGPWFVASHTSGHLAGHHGREAVHALHRQVVLVQGHKEHRPTGRNLEKGRTVLFDRHGPQHAVQGELPQPGDQIRATAEIDLLGQILQHQQPFDLAALDAFQLPALVDVRQEQLAVVCCPWTRGGSTASRGRGRIGRGS
jgi:hypothetical protein